MDQLKIVSFLSRTLAVLFVLVTHEYAHGYVAYRAGDETAKNMGRLSLNPLKHLDPVGTLSMILFRFGWAKPVPINPRNFKSRKRDLFLVSIAGIVINLITAIVAYRLMLILPNIYFVQETLYNLVILGVVFAVFNFLPIPPLDGSKILASFMPVSFEEKLYRFDRYSFFILIGLIYSGLIDKILGPAVNFVLSIITI